MNPTPPSHPAASTTNLTASGILLPAAMADLLFRCFYGQGVRANAIKHEQLMSLTAPNPASSVWIPFPLANSLLLCFYGEGQRYHELSAPLKSPPAPTPPNPTDPAAPKDAPVKLSARILEDVQDLPRTYVPRGVFAKQEKPPASA